MPHSQAYRAAARKRREAAERREEDYMLSLERKHGPAVWHASERLLTREEKEKVRRLAKDTEQARIREFS